MTDNSGFLDPDRPDAARLKVDEAAALGTAALRRLGYPEDEAQIVTDQLIDNALCGYRFASLPRILAIAEDEKSGRPRTPIRTVQETAATALIDGGNHVGYVAVYRGMETAIAKARENGIAAVGVFNSYYSGRNAYYMARIVEAGFVGLHTASGKPRVLPLGGRRPALGTNPVCFGFPSAEGPVVVDMGTAATMWGEVLLAARTGEALPEGVGFDAEGHPSRDARRVAEGGVVPFGGHRGYALSFAVQALGLLAGAMLARGEPQDYGFLFLVVDPGTMLPGNPFAAQMAELVAQIKATPRRPGVAEIRIPGERALRERARRRREGILIDRKVIDALRAL